MTVEYHPIEMMFDEAFRHYMHYSTRGRPVTWDDGVSDYVAESRPAIASSEIITALLAAGLRLEHVREYDYCNGFRPYTQMKDLGERRWTVPDGKPSIPFMYGLVARKPVSRIG